ncbi:MAG: HsdM family class I SAM-dependent methyltransferase [Planctomycetota bacterium]
MQIVALVAARCVANALHLPCPIARLANADTAAARGSAWQCIAEVLGGDPAVAMHGGHAAFRRGEKACGDLAAETAVAAAILSTLSDGCLADLSHSAPADLFRPLYESFFSRQQRHALGEYYTPDWLADHVLASTGYVGDPDARVLDPTCGSGAFLLAAMRTVRAAIGRPFGALSRREATQLAEQLTHNVIGLELGAIAAMTARANLLVALGPLAEYVDRTALAVFEGDSVLAPDVSTDRRLLEAFDFVVGNPPWIAWDNLPADYREATKPLWRRYGLFSLSGNQARHGGGKKDLAMLVVYCAADRWLRQGGRLGMVLTQTLLQSKGAGDGFRRFRLGDGAWLKVLRVDDLVAARPFNAANWTCVLVLEKGVPTTYPVPYYRWAARKSGSPRTVPTGDASSACWAEPIEASRPTSPWLIRPQDLQLPLSAIIGPSDYQARLGANTGGANGVYWLEILERHNSLVRVRNLPGRGRDELPQVETEIESDLLFPLVRWSDVGTFRASPSAAVLLPQDVRSRVGLPLERMEAHYPRTLAYLRQFADTLQRRAAYRRFQARGPFYSMYNVGPYTLSEYKVVWRRMETRLRAAVLAPVDHELLGRRAVVPQETCVLIAAGSSDEAHYLAAVLNSAVARFLVDAHNVRGGKGFGTPSILEYLRLRRFDPADLRHRRLAALSHRAHLAAQTNSEPGSPRRLTEIKREIDGIAAELWGLSADDRAAIAAAVGRTV